jgi:hypothetical protein
VKVSASTFDSASPTLCVSSFTITVSGTDFISVPIALDISFSSPLKVVLIPIAHLPNSVSIPIARIR